MKLKRGYLITFEGVDGSGKSTQCRLLYHHLLEADLVVHLFREPGGTLISEKIRDILLSRDHGMMAPVTEMLLYFASRNQLLDEKIQPALESSEIVLLDRFVDSTLAYQGFGRGLDIDAIQKVRDVAIGDLHPDLTVLVDTPLETAETRLDRSSLDRLEAEQMDFKERTRQGYLTLAAQNADNWLVLNGLEEIQVLQNRLRSEVNRMLELD